MGGFNPSQNPKLKGNEQGIAECCGVPGSYIKEWSQTYIPMGHTAENLAKQYHISREEQDRFALRSHQRAVRAQDEGIFAREIVPVTLPNGETVTVDDGPRRDTSLAKLAALEPAFIQGGTVTRATAARSTTARRPRC